MVHLNRYMRKFVEFFHQLLAATAFVIASLLEVGD